jgi:hypothetical protein
MARMNGLDIMTLGVKPGERNRGLGSQILALLCDRLRELQCQRATLHVQCINNAAVSFYLRNDFEIVEHLKHHYLIDGVNYDAYYMSKSLLHVQPATCTPDDATSVASSACSRMFNYLSETWSALYNTSLPATTTTPTAQMPALYSIETHSHQQLPDHDEASLLFDIKNQSTNVQHQHQHQHQHQQHREYQEQQCSTRTIAATSSVLSAAASSYPLTIASTPSTPSS